MAGNPYPVHGFVEQRRVGQIMVADLHGPWNLECMQDAVRRANPVIDDMLRTGPVGIIIVVHDSMLGTSDSLAEIRGKSAERSQDGRIAVAWVAHPGIEGRELMVSVLEETYRNTLPMRIFHDVESAERWIQGFIESTRAPILARSG
ncbi:MAG TPA: hypothetical protein VFB36_00140 [Nevskiaceae bacterium]|nr:hypothetical protein [Nevskiaceae bacterium]